MDLEIDETGDSSLDPERSHASFHGRLLDRSRTRRPESRSRGERIRRKLRDFLFVRLLPVLGDGAIFGGGLAFGAAGMLLYRGEPLKGSPALMIAIGLGCVIGWVFARLLEWDGRSRPLETHGPT